MAAKSGANPLGYERAIHHPLPRRRITQFPSIEKPTQSSCRSSIGIVRPALQPIQLAPQLLVGFIGCDKKMPDVQQRHRQNAERDHHGPEENPIQGSRHQTENTRCHDDGYREIDPEPVGTCLTPPDEVERSAQGRAREPFEIIKHGLPLRLHGRAQSSDPASFRLSQAERHYRRQRRLQGSMESLNALLTETGTKLVGRRNGPVRDWRPQRDSNPCYRRERPMS